jgi:hypothetical protein
VKYFFLSEGWTIGRVWGVGGLWNETAWRRLPDIQKLNLCLWDQNEKMWLYRVEDAVLMVEVKATPAHLANNPGQNIGNVVLTRLITADQVLERLCSSFARCEILPSTSLGSSQDRGG